MRHTMLSFAFGLVVAAVGCAGDSDNGNAAGSGGNAAGAGAGGNAAGSGGSAAGSGGNNTGGTGGSGPSGVGCTVSGQKALASGVGLPTLTWTGSGYLALWSVTAGGDIQAQPLTANGDPNGGATTIDAPNTGAYPRAAAVPGGGAFVVFENCLAAECSDTGSSSVYGASLGAAPKELSAPVAIQRRPHVAVLNGRVFAAFRDVDGGKTVARVVQVAPETATVTGTPATLGSGDSAEFPALATSGDRLAAAYVRGNSNVVVALFNDALAPQGETAKLNSQGSRTSNPAIAWTDGAWLTAWEDERTGAPLLASAISGTTPGAEVVIDTGDGNWPSIASGGGSTVVAHYSGRDIYVTRVGVNGGVTGEPVRVTMGGESRFPALAHNPQANEFGLVWKTDANAVQFARVTCR